MSQSCYLSPNSRGEGKWLANPGLRSNTPPPCSIPSLEPPYQKKFQLCLLLPKTHIFYESRGTREGNRALQVQGEGCTFLSSQYLLLQRETSLAWASFVHLYLRILPGLCSTDFLSIPAMSLFKTMTMLTRLPYTTDLKNQRATQLHRGADYGLWVPSQSSCIKGYL